MDIDIKTTLELEPLGKSARVHARVAIQGMETGKVMVCSGPRDDIEDFYYGRITIQQLHDRIMPKGQTTTPITWRDYVFCPHCRGSFSFSKPHRGVCPWCSRSIPPKPGEPGYERHA